MASRLVSSHTAPQVSGPIISWQIEGEKVEAVTDFIFLGSKIIADVDCSHEVKRRSLLGRKAMTNLDSIFKNRDITLLSKAHIVKVMFFYSIHIQGEGNGTPLQCSCLENPRDGAAWWAAVYGVTQGRTD